MTITRPDLSSFCKNLAWLSAHGERYVDMIKGKPVKEVLAMARRMTALGGPTGLCAMMTTSQLADGSLVMVSKEVSAALEASKISVESLSAIPWPAQRLEIAWEDSTLPNMLIHLIAPEENVSGQKVTVAMLQQPEHPVTGERAGVVMNFPDHKLDELMRGEFLSEATLPRVMPFDEGLTPDEAAALSYMTVLALKVLAFAAVPEVRDSVKRLNTHAERKSAGVLARGKGAPTNGNVWHVRTLPRVASAERSEGDEPTGVKREFKGRIGHIRHFNSEFYKNVRGTWKWIPPIAPPEGIRWKFVIRPRSNSHA